VVATSSDWSKKRRRLGSPSEAVLVRRIVLACSFALGLSANEGAAFGNGRFPRAQRLIEDNGDGDRLTLAATYGLLVTNDRGSEWRHSCELGYAFSIDELDPLVEMPPDGALLVTAAHSLNRAVPPFCAFEPVLGGAGTEAVVDYALDAGDRTRVLAVLMSSGDGGIVNALYESLDAGRTFAPFGAPLPASEVAFAVTLDIAPSDPNRIYVSAAGRAEPELLLRSDDAGARWTTTPLAVAPEEYPYIAAVHPTDPDVLYVRTDFWKLDEQGVLTANDALLHSEDGGATFREIHRAAGKLFGFALSSDGTELVIGYGDPVESSRRVDPEVLGIYRASTADHVFAKIYDGSVSCLTWTQNGLYVCTSQAERGFALGIAASADFELTTEHPLTPLLDLAAVKGPIDCPAESSGAACRERWSESCSIFGNCDAGTAGDGGTTGSPGTKSASTNDPSCGCRTAGARTRSGLPAFGALVVATLARLARRRGRAGDAGVRAKRGS
jgi:hypothetical protein